MPTHNKAGIDFDTMKTADGRDARAVFNADKSIVHNPTATDERKEEALKEMHAFEDAERHTAAGYKGTILNPNRDDHTKAAAAERLVRLPHFQDEPK
ncbi:hypothetical protein JCM10450v2_005979 [Rhodotorula kratochvilovae]